ncbi:hypothetical protein L1987_46437 [Smallanthus sonchifolius]|uniref:Uncharacterized protein n=1 Tax=Smallanthus sonchifolius TaxID=185202 RepID=A0ACB9G0Q0_9ASTR|nr:hypothetical protein L1987_46437 [Smallanthus sonchifolius]
MSFSALLLVLLCFDMQYFTIDTVYQLKVNILCLITVLLTSKLIAETHDMITHMQVMFQIAVFIQIDKLIMDGPTTPSSHASANPTNTMSSDANTAPQFPIEIWHGNGESVEMP